MTMARKKTSKPRAAPVTTAAKSLAIRVNRNHAGRIERLAAADRATVPGLLDRPLVHDASRIGFAEQAPHCT